MRLPAGPRCPEVSVLQKVLFYRQFPIGSGRRGSNPRMQLGKLSTKHTEAACSRPPFLRQLSFDEDQEDAIGRAWRHDHAIAYPNARGTHRLGGSREIINRDNQPGSPTLR